MAQRFRYLVTTTTLFVFATILLGVATKSYGAGLACQARWPVCDGGLLNLFPRSFPSFFEWIHRVVAGIGGLFIVGTALVSWRGDVDDAVRNALTVGAVLTPLQVFLGQQTVVNFTVPILTAHFWTAFTIFGAFAFATVAVWADAIERRHLLAAAVGSLVLLPVEVLLTPPFIERYTPVIQTLQYAVLLGLLSCVIALVVLGRPLLPDAPRRQGPVLALAVLPVAILLGRHVIGASALHRGGYFLSALVVFGALAITAIDLSRTDVAGT